MWCLRPWRNCPPIWRAEPERRGGLTLVHPNLDRTRFIRDNLRLTQVPMIPDLRLYTAHPGSRLRRLLPQGEGALSPYWAWLWAGGLVLARFIIDNPQVVAGRRILDLGAGSGLVGIAAARAGAALVTCADIDPNAIAAVRLNADTNRVAVIAVEADLTNSAPPEIDTLLAGDIFYDSAVARRVLPYLDRCAALGIEVLVGDPGREPLPLTRLRKLAEYAVPDFGDPEGGTRKPSAVYALEPC